MAAILIHAALIGASRLVILATSAIVCINQLGL